LLVFSSDFLPFGDGQILLHDPPGAALSLFFLSPEEEAYAYAEETPSSRGAGGEGENVVKTGGAADGEGRARNAVAKGLTNERPDGLPRGATTAGRVRARSALIGGAKLGTARVRKLDTAPPASRARTRTVVAGPPPLVRPPAMARRPFCCFRWRRRT